MSVKTYFGVRAHECKGAIWIAADEYLKLKDRISDLERAGAENILSLDEKITHLQEENDRLKEELREQIHHRASNQAIANRMTSAGFKAEQRLSAQVACLSELLADIWQRSQNDIQSREANERLESSERQRQAREVSLLVEAEKQTGVKL
jgi:hypothetical protein